MSVAQRTHTFDRQLRSASSQGGNTADVSSAKRPRKDTAAVQTDAADGENDGSDWKRLYEQTREALTEREAEAEQLRRERDEWKRMAAYHEAVAGANEAELRWIAEELSCPITHALSPHMVIADDKQVYSLEAIYTHLHSKRCPAEDDDEDDEDDDKVRSPVTRSPMSDRLTSCTQLRKVVERLVDCGVAVTADDANAYYAEKEKVYELFDKWKRRDLQSIPSAEVLLDLARMCLTGCSYFGCMPNREAAVSFYCLAGDKGSMEGAREAAFAMIFIDSRPGSSEKPRTLELRSDIISGDNAESDTLPAAVRYLTIAARLGSLQACWAGMKLAQKFGNMGITNVVGWWVWAEHVEAIDDGMTPLQLEELHEMSVNESSGLGGALARNHKLQSSVLEQIRRLIGSQ
jgi:hypothetical protein